MIDGKARRKRGRTHRASRAGASTSAEPAAEFARELEIAKRAALAAGAALRRHYYRRRYRIGSKGHNNPVTSADLAADRTLKRMLGRAFPDYGWLSEETADSAARLRRRRVWIVDPLDGTREFITSVPEFCVAIALVVDGRPVLGVSYNPIKREMFWAARGMGCHLNRRRVRVTRTRVLRRATVLASRSETARGEWEVFHGRMMVSPTGSVAYKLALVAAGRADATFSRTPKSEWDIASGAVLVAEAGGAMTDIRGRELRFNRRSVLVEGILADNARLHKRLLAIAQPTRAAKARTRR